MGAHGFTAEQIESSIESALKAHDMVTVVSLLKLLASVDAERAQIIMNAFILANEIRAEMDTESATTA